MDDGTTTKNGHAQTSDSNTMKNQSIIKEESKNEDVRATPDSLRERKDELQPKTDDNPANGSIRSGSPTQSHSTHTKRGEKQVKPNKVYIGGLPEHTRQEDLQACFGKIGEIVAIELKLGYGFVEFTTRAAAEESVEKYNEGYFMGNKIRVELSHGGGRTAKYAGEPGACFKCGQQGHWARECPTAPPNERAASEGLERGRHYMAPYPAPGNDRTGGKVDYSGRYYLPPRETRYAEGYPPTREYRDYRPPRPASPPRSYRDYPAPVRSSREYEDYRMRAAPLPSRYDSRSAYYPPPPDPGYREAPPGYAPRPGYMPREVAYDRRPPPDRYMYAPPSAARPRSPAGPPPPRTSRDEYERVTPPLRDYPQPSMGDYRSRLSPSRYTEDRPRYRRRSQSPVSRSAGTGYAEPPLGYPVTSASYSGSGGGTRPTRDEYRPERNTRA